MSELWSACCTNQAWEVRQLEFLSRDSSRCVEQHWAERRKTTRLMVCSVTTTRKINPHTNFMLTWDTMHTNTSFKRILNSYLSSTWPKMLKAKRCFIFLKMLFLCWFLKLKCKCGPFYKNVRDNSSISCNARFQILQLRRFFFTENVCEITLNFLRVIFVLLNWLGLVIDLAVVVNSINLRCMSLL